MPIETITPDHRYHWFLPDGRYRGLMTYSEACNEGISVRTGAIPFLDKGQDKETIANIERRLKKEYAETVGKYVK